MLVATERESLAHNLSQLRAKGESLALVPTMGNLHEGHLALIQEAKRQADRVAVSIFVNPLQFGPTEDFAAYPRTLEDDMALCQLEGVDLVFAPVSNEVLYNTLGSPTLVVPPPELTERLCGLSRPGHFIGVATVVTKLLNLIQPTVAVFGEKDAQQLVVLQRTVTDLDLPVRLVLHPVVRDTDGLALSSRNRYLASPEAREAALTLSKTLQALAYAWRTGKGQLPQPLSILADVQAGLSEAARSACTLEYLEMVDPDTLEPLTAWREAPALLVMAASIRTGANTGDNAPETVRLIDAVRVAASS